MKTKTKLLPHQEAAVEKLKHLVVGAMYMEMGTGKTRTAAELCVMRLNQSKIDHVIWLCPCSVKANLATDLNKHLDGWRGVITICGIETLSSSVPAILDLLELSENKRCCLIVDESNLVKNPFALRSQHISTIAKNCKYKLILNGTPIARSYADLFWQFYILDPRILGYKSYYSFARNHIEYDAKIPGKINRILNTQVLTDKIAPYTYQVKKDECIKLPDKRYHTYWCRMTAYQESIYGELADRYLMELDEMRPETIYRLFGVLQHCISGIEVREHGELGKKGHYLEHREIFDDGENPRLNLLSRIIKDDIGDDQAVIFCKYTHEIHKISRMLGDAAALFYGELPLKKRQASIDRLKVGDAKYLIANKTCGAYGLNLQFCYKMIFYSNDWDYATRIQAEDRIHRIGQRRDVDIYDIITEYSLDEKIYKCLNRKGRLSDEFKKDMAAKKNMREWLFGKDISK